MERPAKRILVIDDDERHLVAAKGLLEDAGYEVITHNHWIGSTSAVMKLKPDLVLLDINMPALSGDRLSMLFRTNGSTRNVAVVFYSSNDEDSLRKLVLKCGVAGYICKGDVFELRRKVGFYLDTACRET
ncbi:MAG: response regulator [Nitrospirae bacterium]|nr:response regulator [Nitrospirota bacterium]